MYFSVPAIQGIQMEDSIRRQHASKYNNYYITCNLGGLVYQLDSTESLWLHVPNLHTVIYFNFVSMNFRVNPIFDHFAAF